MRTAVALVLALSPLAASGCGPTCGDVSNAGNAYVAVHLLPQSDVTSPESIVVSSPVQMTGTISAYGQVKVNRSTLSAAISPDANGGRLLLIDWSFVDLDHNSPPSDQFDATVTDAAGNVTGQEAATGEFVWVAADGCEPGHWWGPETYSDN